MLPDRRRLSSKKTRVAMMPGPVLPPWIDRARPLAGVVLAIAPVYLIFILYYGGNPRTLAVGYQPEQPLPYSHALHAGELGIDCRYCHNTVERAAFAAVPPTATCMNCHATIAADSDKLVLVQQSAATGAPIHWLKVNDLPDYVYFNHSAHVARGVGCVSCHGRVDKMERRLPGGEAEHGLVSRLPSPSGAALAAAAVHYGHDLDAGRGPGNPRREIAERKQHQSLDGLLDMSSLERKDKLGTVPIFIR